MNSDLGLRRKYNAFNKRYFNGELPSNTVIWYEPCVRACGETVEIDGAEELGIKIDPSVLVFSRLLDQTVIHEMAHVRLWPLGYKLKDHGNRWDEEIKRLTTYKSYRKLL